MMHKKYAGPENCLWQKISAAYTSDFLSYETLQNVSKDGGHLDCDETAVVVAALRAVGQGLLQVLHFQTATRFHAKRVNVL